MIRDNWYRIILMALRVMAPAALGALGAALLFVYPEGFHAFCAQVP